MKLALALIAGAAASAPILFAEDHGITNHWIVTLEPGDFKAWKTAEMATKAAPDAEVRHVYNIGNGKFLGFSALIESQTTLNVLSNLPGVKRIEQDALAFATQASRPIDQTGHWGLDRADGTFDNAYRHHASGGEGATIYILDTGVRLTHNDYNGRARFGANFTPSQPGDRHGHGTHCGCTAGGDSHGIASAADVVDVKVLGDSGSGAWSGVIEGIEWADTDCPGSVCVQSLSLGGGATPSVDDAVNAAADSKSAMIIASGNSNADACNFSPARATGAFTVNSAQRSGDSLTRSSFSNYGSCSDMYSAGSTVLSCGVSSDSATATMSGTSMATPHVAGHAAVCISEEGASSVDAVYNCLREHEDPNAVSGNPSGPNGYAQYEL